MDSYHVDRHGVVVFHSNVSDSPSPAKHKTQTSCGKDKVARRHEAFLKERQRHRKLAAKGLA